MKTRLLIAVFVCLLFMLATAGPAAADGFIIPEPIEEPAPIHPIWPPLPTPAPRTPPVVPYLTVKYHQVEVSISDQVAHTKVDQVFVNDTNRDVEGTYIFPLPEDAAISNFAMYVDGRKMEGKLLTKEEARRIYEQTVRSRKDPALLEYIGRGAFQARVYPIPPKGERRIQIEYTQVLARDNDLVRYVYPLNTEKFSPKPLQQVSVRVTIASREAIKAVYSSSHDVAISRKGDYFAEASYEATNTRPDKDFVLYYGLQQGEMGASLLTYRQPGEDGYFLLLVTPRTEVAGSQIAAKDVILVLDTSGSMLGQKIAQAKEALRFVLDRLNPDDHFALITFNTSVDRFGEGLLTVREREAAKRFVNGIAAAGSTNINAALLEAFKGVDPERPTVVIFLTDGLPTTGVTDPARIIENAGRAAPKNVRLFTFGVGFDVNTALLDTLAANHRGVSAYIKPGEDLEAVVSDFYAKISRPVLTDVTLDFAAIRVMDLYPNPLPDLFAGSQLAVVGRYRTSGGTTVTVKGQVNGRPQQFAYSDLSFPAQTTPDTAFVARLWATRRIGYLLTEIRLHGADKELVDEVVSLSLRYGIITPYTSFLVDERQDILSQSGQQRAADTLGKTLPSAPAAGATAVTASESLRALREAPSAAGAATSAQVRSVADKTFLLRNGFWTDTTYKDGMRTVDIGFGSDDYFALIAAHPEWAAYFAVGDKVIVVLGGTAYRVAEGTFPPITIPPTPTAGSSRPDATPQRTPVVVSPTRVPPTPTAVSPMPTVPAPTMTPAPYPMPEPPAGPNIIERFWRWLRRFWAR